jgi:hypothetical protein
MHVRLSVVVVVLFSIFSWAEEPIPAGTVLAARLNSSITSKKIKLGQSISARIMQDVPLTGRKISAGTKVLGRVIAVTPSSTWNAAQITFRFDGLYRKHETIPIRTNLRALAGMMEVHDAQIPPTGPDRGTPWAWATRNLIGGEVAYGEGGPVARGTETVGRALADGVLVPAEANPSAGCRGDVGEYHKLQALWVFSSDACGLYGFEELKIAHAGRTVPIGEITLTSKHGDVKLDAGSGMLLRVNSPQPEQNEPPNAAR